MKKHIESLSAPKFAAITNEAMRFIVGGGNSVSEEGVYNGVKASNDYVECNGGVKVGSHEGYDFTEKEKQHLNSVECPTTKVAK